MSRARNTDQQARLQGVIERAGGAKAQAPPPDKTTEITELRGVNVHVNITDGGNTHELQIHYHDGRKVLVVRLDRLTAAGLRRDWEIASRSAPGGGTK